MKSTPVVCSTYAFQHKANFPPSQIFFAIANRTVYLHKMWTAGGYKVLWKYLALSEKSSGWSPGALLQSRYLQMYATEFQE